MDLNDRKISDIKERTPFLPFCPAKYGCKLSRIYPHETSEAAGTQLEFVIQSARKTAADDPRHNPMAEQGETYALFLKWKICTPGWKCEKDGKTLRLALAALSGVEHTPEFDAMTALKDLYSLDEAEALDEIPEFELERVGTKSKGKAGTEHEGKEFINYSDYVRSV